LGDASCASFLAVVGGGAGGGRGGGEKTGAWIFIDLLKA
jgi:hypothetical protein